MIIETDDGVLYRINTVPGAVKKYRHACAAKQFVATSAQSTMCSFFTSSSGQSISGESTSRHQEILVSGLAAVVTDRFIAAAHGGRGIRGAAGTGRGVATILENASVGLRLDNHIDTCVLPSSGDEEEDKVETEQHNHCDFHAAIPWGLGIDPGHKAAQEAATAAVTPSKSLLQRLLTTMLVLWTMKAFAVIGKFIRSRKRSKSSRWRALRRPHTKSIKAIPGNH